MNYFYPSFLILIYFFVLNVSAQGYSVLEHTKFSEENLNGFVNLDNEDWFAHSIEGIGDLNGDGFNDFIVGANQDDDGGTNRGAVYVFFMDEDYSVQSVQKISDISGDFDAPMLDWDYFGRSISYLGDLNNDGKIEVAISAEYDNEAGHRFGGIYILTLNTDGTVFEYQKINQIHGNFNGGLQVWDVFGSDIANIGDLNGDGFTDIAVGARRDGDGGQERGAVYILFLNQDFTVNYHEKISMTSGNFNVNLEFQDYFGASITSLGDLNGDGVIDLAVGAYRDNDGGLNKGAVYILFMNDDGTVSSHQKISELEGNLNDKLAEDLRFGKSSSNIRDIDQDGKVNLLVGCKKNLFYILNLNPDGTVDSFEKYTEGINNFNGELDEEDFFGYSISQLAIQNNSTSILVSSFGDSEFGFQKGSFWILEIGERELSVEDIEKQNSNFLYPNPTNDSFSFFMVENIQKVEIYSMDGKKVAGFNIVTNNNFNVSLLPAGTYLVKASSNSGDADTYKITIR